MNYNIKEDEDNQSSFRLDQDLILTTTEDIQEVVDALENIDNYGIYLSNIRKPNTNKAIEDYFGPSHPSKKKTALKARGGEPFPLRTKQSIDDFIKSLTNKPNLLDYKVEGNTIVFPKESNETKENIKRIIDTVMNNANITKYKLTKKESSTSIEEGKKLNQIRQFIREEIKNTIKEEETMFKIEPKITFKIYDILKKHYPEIGNDYTKSSFFYLINNEL